MVMNRSSLTRFQIGAALFSLSLLSSACFSAYAQTSSQNDVYPAAFFNKYTPQNALEMIERLPGFSFDSGSNARGFGANAGNVLIDGARPTSKSGGLRGSLLRIPASQVERIEIIRGGAGAGEAQGQSVVANVIRKAEVESSGRWALKYRQTQGANPEPNLEYALTTKLGDWDTSWDADIGGRPGYRSAILDRVDGQEQLITGIDEALVERSRWTFINGEGASFFADGKLTITGRIGADAWRGDFKRQIFAGRMPDGSDFEQHSEFNDRFSMNVRELGADWVRSFEDWKVRVIGLANVRNEEFSSAVAEQDFALASMDNIDYSEDSTQSEYIFRSTFSALNLGALKPEFGFEVAKNELDKSSILSVNGDILTFGNDDVIVQEQRGEAFANMSYEVNDKLTIEAGLTAEMSKIEVNSFDADNETLTFYKPRFSATYIPTDGHSLTFEAERFVGQLDFDDFAASSDTMDSNSTSGNSNLQPDKIDEIALTYEWNFSERGSFKARPFYQWRSDILEQVILNDDPDNYAVGVGNAGDAKFWGVDFNLTLPIDYVLQDGLLEISHNYRDAEYYDEVIDANRTISYFVDLDTDISFRQDLTEHGVTWGGLYRMHFIDTAYRVDEFQAFRGNNRLELFVETTKFWGVKLRFEVSEINTGQFTRTREIYSPDRSGELAAIERSRRFREPFYTLAVSGTF